MSARMLLLLLMFVGCCGAALLDENDVDTRAVDSLLTYLDQQMTSDLSDDDFMHYIVVNATNGNETYEIIDEWTCSDIFACPRSGGPPTPAGSPQDGFYISSGFVRKECRYIKELMYCYVKSDYTDCPYVTALLKQLTPVYRYMCKQPGHTAVLKFLPCVNNYDVQVTMFENYIKLVSAIWTIFNWPDPAEDAYNTMICRAFAELRRAMYSSIMEQCGPQDFVTFGELYSAMTSKMLSKHSCDVNH